MGYSLEILVIGQKEHSEIPFKSPLKIEWENGGLGDIRLRKICPIMSSMNGIWYNVLIRDEVYFYNTSLLIETDFDETEIDVGKDYCMEEDVGGHTQFIITEKYFEELKQLIGYLMNQSPIKTIMILPLYEKMNREVIRGTVSFTRYFEMVKERKIPFNVCTIVQGDNYYQEKQPKRDDESFIRSCWYNPMSCMAKE
ncbi:MAG: hypothetical protein Q4F83_02950 [Eubacteriales bacterium]|nr:hypothetical protein [Eubacteriales bacterium]